MASPSSAGLTAPVALTDKQESRLIIYLDEHLSVLQRKYESRHSPNAILPTIGQYLSSLLELLPLILQIPPIQPSASLRIAYYLNLTGLLPDALSGYPLELDSLPEVWRALRTFDNGWRAVLHGQEWDSSIGAARGTPRSEPDLTWTDRARLSSLISEVRSTLAIALGLPAHGGEDRGREYNPRGEIVEPRMKPLEVEMTNGEEGEGEEGALELGRTPSLVEDATGDEEDKDDDLEVMEVDTPEDGEDEEDDDFEEIEVEQPGSPSTASAFSPPPPEPFSIHFHAEPAPAPAPAPTSAPSAPHALDPDEEYGDQILDNDEDRGVKVECDKVFEGTITALREMGVQASAA